MPASSQQSVHRFAGLERWLLLAIIALAYVGFVDSTYITVHHFLGSEACSVHSGCRDVLSSAFSQIGPIPVSILGSAFYASCIMLAIAAMQGVRSARSWLTNLIRLAFAVSIYFLAVQLFVLNATCPFCLLSFAVSSVLLVLSELPARLAMSGASAGQSTTV